MAGNRGKRMEFGDKCKDCEVEITPFNAKYVTGYLQMRCADCFKARYNSKRKGYSLKYHYGMTESEYDQKRWFQLNGCAICKQPFDKEPHVDHDHKTGLTRDLLCVRCNVVLGQVNDDEELLFAMIEYLKRHAKRPRTA